MAAVPARHTHAPRTPARSPQVWGITRSADTAVIGEKGQDHPDLFPFISHESVMIDFLHMLLRIGELFLHLTAVKLLAAGNVVWKEGQGDDQPKSSEFLAAQLGGEITRVAKVGEVRWEHKRGRWSCLPGLTADRLLAVLRGLDFTRLPIFAADPDRLCVLRERLQAAIREFVALYDLVNMPHPFENSTIDAKALSDRIHRWVFACVAEQEGPSEAQRAALFPLERFLTPYMHAFIWHVVRLLIVHGDLHEFVGQDLELVNGIHGAMWARVSCKRRGHELMPVLMCTLRRDFNDYTALDDVLPYPCPAKRCSSTFKKRGWLESHWARLHAAPMHPEWGQPLDWEAVHARQQRELATLRAARRDLVMETRAAAEEEAERALVERRASRASGPRP